jgi:hypothetical protein
VNKRRAEKLFLSNGPNILKKENCYVIRLEVNVLQICASMYTLIIKISQMINEERVAKYTLSSSFSNLL